jgi:hypothetical protein
VHVIRSEYDILIMEWERFRGDIIGMWLLYQSLESLSTIPMLIVMRRTTSIKNPNHQVSHLLVVITYQ